jgi:predicted nucleic acid-binding Zn ribbon protein
MANKKKHKNKMNIGKTRKTKMDYLMYLIMAAVAIQLILLLYRLLVLTEL